MAHEKFYLVKNGKSVCRFVYSEYPYPFDVYKDVTPPEPVKNISSRLFIYLNKTLLSGIYNTTGAWPSLIPEDRAGEFCGNKVYVGRCFTTDLSGLGDANAYQYAIVHSGNTVTTLAHTYGGYYAAAEKIHACVRYSEDQKDAWLAEEVFGIFDHDLPPLRHAFPKFTVSFYGSPYNRASLEDEKTFRGIVEFGTDEVPLHANWHDADAVAGLRTLIKRFYAEGITTRLYGAAHPGDCDPLEHPERAEEYENEIRGLVETFGDLEGISQWGYWDEPEAWHFNLCSFARTCFRRYDPKKRPVYINLGPRAHSFGVQTFYSEFSRLVHPDYYCFDRYPFFMTEKGAEMTDLYFYSNFELQRAFAIDDGVDHGAILAAIKVGADPARSDITPHFMRWQTNLLAAYGCRYIEYYVYYYAHEYSILDKNNDPTWRWELCRETTEYLKAVFSLLDDHRLDAVFHLPKPDGTYDLDVIPYYGWRGIGEVTGYDAILSFYDAGILVVTDKHADPFDGGEHEILLTGFAGTEWFDPEKREFVPIGDCPETEKTAEGLKIHLTLASQYIFRQTDYLGEINIKETLEKTGTN